jgi:hypothetical protein
VLVTLANRRWVRVLGAVYPAFTLFDIVATANRFWFDAAAGGAVVVAGLVDRTRARARIACGDTTSGSAGVTAVTSASTSDAATKLTAAS